MPSHSSIHVIPVPFVFLKVRFSVFYFLNSCSDLKFSVVNFDVFCEIRGCKFSIFSFALPKTFVGLSCSSVYVTSILSQSFSDVSFIRKLLQWTTLLWWINEVLHVLKMKYFIQKLFGRYLLHLVHFVHYFSTLVQSRLYVGELK